MPYINYTPTTVFTKVMFDFSGIVNFKFSGAVKVSVSDGFSNLDYYLGLVNSTDLTMDPYSNEIVWSSQVKTNIAATLAIISQFSNIKFSTLTDYDHSGIYSIASPADVGLLSDINISYMNSNSTRLLGMSSLNSDLFGYSGSRGDIFINYTGSAFSVEGVTFADYTKSRQVLLHETLHSLGLSHPFKSDYSVKENFNLLMDLGFDKFGFPVSSKEVFNKEYFTIMSYDDENYETLNNAYTPMILDVIALQQAYGEGVGTTTSGDDVIKAGNVGYRSYFDAGGKDTIDLNIYVSGAYLSMGEQIKGADHLVGLLTNQDDHINITKGKNVVALRWFYGEIENAVGSVGGDFIAGNYLGNSIRGEGGDDSINGGDGNDSLHGGDGNDTFDWEGNQRGGDDSMVGGLGNDIYVINSTGDKVEENLNEGNDTAWAAIDYVLPANVEVLKLFGTDNVSATGNELSNYIYGNSGNNSIHGGDGNDTLHGGDGNDTFDWNGNQRGGDDSMVGGLGSDIYVINSTGDKVEENLNEGNDTVWTAIDYVLPANVEVLKLFGTANVSAMGNELSNYIYGNSGDNSLNGGGGDDFISAGEGVDAVDGGDGVDTLMLSGNRDSYLITKSQSGNLISLINSDSNVVLKNIEFINFSDNLIAFNMLINQAPVATAATVTTDEDTVANRTLLGVDADGNSLTFFKITDPSHGTVSISAKTGAFIYTPAANYNGNDSFTFKVNDGTVDSAVATVSISITPVSDIAGQIYHWKSHSLLQGVQISDGAVTASSDINGNYHLNASNSNSDLLIPTLSTQNIGAAIDILDAQAALKIAVGLNPNNNGSTVSPYQYIAADVNEDGVVTSADALAIYKMVSARSDAPLAKWLFVDEAEDFWNEAINSFTTSRKSVIYDKSIDVNTQSDVNANLVAVLKGDVNGSWAPPAGTLNLDAINPNYFAELSSRSGLPQSQWVLVV